MPDAMFVMMLPSLMLPSPMSVLLTVNVLSAAWPLLLANQYRCFARPL